jgi:hypothetical protein
MYGVDLATASPTGSAAGSSEDLPGHYGHHHHRLQSKPTVYAYDAAAEREAERLRLEQLAEAQWNGSTFTTYERESQATNGVQVIR